MASVDLDGPSPFASSLLFAFVAAYLYEADAPLAERRETSSVRLSVTSGSSGAWSSRSRSMCSACSRMDGSCFARSTAITARQSVAE